MTYPLTFVELFAGVGGLSLGLEMAGWKCLGHAEWEDFPRRVLKHRWPEVPLWGDVSTLNGHEMVAQVGPFTMLTFGAPCQDFSVAGKREGLDGERSVLVLDAIRIWEQSGAPLALYENVVGMLSSNKGEDFGAILSTFVGARVAVPARGWRGGAGVACGPAGVAAWRVLDAQYFGVPQRRRRVFVLCSRDPRIDPAEVLSLAEGVSGHSPKGKRARQGAPGGTGASLGGEGRDGGVTFAVRTANTGANGWGVSEETSHTLDLAQGQAVVHTAVLASETALAINISNGEPRLSDVMGTLQARATSGGVGSGAQMNAVLPILEATARQGKSMEGSVGIGQDGDPMFTLQATKQHGVFAFAQNQRGELRTSEVAPQLTTGGGKPGEGYSAVLSFDSTFGHNANVFTDCAPPVKVGSGEGIASPPAVLAFDGYNQQVTGEVTMTLRKGSDSCHVPIAFNATIDKQTGLVSEGVSPTLKTDLAHQMGPVVTQYGEIAGSLTARGDSSPCADCGQNIVATFEWHGQDSRVREIDVAASLNRNAEGREGHLVLHNPVTAFKIRGGVDVDSAGKQAGKGYLGSEEMALTLGTTQDQHLFDTRITPTVMSSGQAKAEFAQDKSTSLTTRREAPILFPPSAEVFPTLDAAEGRKWGSNQWINNGKCVHVTGVPRRLTPVECERLMGWPDGWTDVPDAKGKPAPDTARYKACGNGVASPVSAWIGFQLKAVLTKDTL